MTKKRIKYEKVVEWENRSNFWLLFYLTLIPLIVNITLGIRFTRTLFLDYPGVQFGLDASVAMLVILFAGNFLFNFTDREVYWEKIE